MATTVKKSAVERVRALLDENSFVEIGALVSARSTDFNLGAKKEPSDGVVTGYGLIEGRLVYVYSQDASVLGGSVGEMHAKKIVDLYKLALKTGAPVIALLDSCGLRLEESTDALCAFSQIYAQMSAASGVIPQISAVFGTCGGGLALIPALADFSFMEAKNGKLFVNAPNTLAGNTTEKCDSSSAAFQSEQAGTIDFCGTGDEIISGIRQLVSVLPSNNAVDADFLESEDDINRACDDMENCLEDTSIALSRLSDDGLFVETKKGSAREMATGFIKLNGITVGAVANRTKVYDDEMNVTDEFEPKLSAGGCRKAASFVKFCDAFNIPVLTLTNAAGFKASLCEEKRIAQAAAQLSCAFASSTVPKVNVLIGKAHGSAFSVMNPKSLGADIVFAIPSASVGTMDSEMAVKIMYADEIEASSDKKSFIAEKKAEYDILQNSVDHAAARGAVDAIIEPVDLRKHLIGAFEVLYTKAENGPVKKHGTV